jgi:hypothetical protein
VGCPIGTHSRVRTCSGEFVVERGPGREREGGRRREGEERWERGRGKGKGGRRLMEYFKQDKCPDFAASSTVYAFHVQPLSCKYLKGNREQMHEEEEKR